ncbi:TonB-dependent receptor domain-containing protein [Novosphingobium sp. KA1]|uniref:TonB-dependent receptor domain-containing protein n=1 Tax=Novosphingobium sp. (strain KA1) TaxID=164608 RepID=UPI001A8FF536|nr:TonB-dependent receptor [Novosphingobium sp. KA1]
MSGLLSAKLNQVNRIDLEGAWSRQGNSFVGGQPSGVVNPDGTSVIDQLAQSNAETSRLTRTTVSLTHKGDYAFGTANSYVQWEHTLNRRLTESNSGGGEAIFNSATAYSDTTLDNVSAKSEWSIPFNFVLAQNMTLGADFRGEHLEAPISLTAGTTQKDSAYLFGLYAEDNISVTDSLTLTPGLRFDHHNKFGGNLSPSLNGFLAVTSTVTIKAGIARAFKAPNLYQLSPDYFYSSRGNGCPAWYSGQCYIKGNPDLKPEISINKEIGVAYADKKGIAASVTYYHNAYKNKITTGEELSTTLSGINYFNWENSGPATISGIEGNFTIPFGKLVSWNTNFTKVLKSERETYGQLADGTTGALKTAVSLVPKYTINNTLRISPTDNFGINLRSTHYGRIDPADVNVKGVEIPKANQIPRKPYMLVNFGVDYKTGGIKLAAGIDNVLKKKINATYNTTGTATAGTVAATAKTFNEPGRTFWLSLTNSF